MIFVRWQEVDKVEDAENYIAVERKKQMIPLHQEDMKKILLLEWVDPYFSAGHWVPEQIELRRVSICHRNKMISQED